MTFTNEYRFNTVEKREFSIRHIARLIEEGYVITKVEDDETKTLVTFKEVRCG